MADELSAAGADARVARLIATPALLIGDRWRPAPAIYPVVDPTRECRLGDVADAGAAEAADAVAAATAARAGWARVPVATRAAALAAAAGRLEEQRDDLVELVVAETGATRAVAATTQVDAAITRLRRYAAVTHDDLHRWLPQGGDDGGRPFRARRRPVGVVACIAPYNFPLLAMVGKVAPALVAGNPVVMKPAPQAPLAVVALARALDGALRDTGAPPGTVNLLTGAGPDAGRALTTSPDVAMVSFTGSTDVGEEIYAAGAPSMKRLLLELGGKGACVVLDDADLDRAVDTLARTWTVQAGQVCLAPTRAVVHRGVHGPLVARLTARLRSLTVGDPRHAATDVGPLISSVQRDRVMGHVAGAVDAGARPVVTAGPGDLPGRGWFVPPTLLDGCRPDMAIADQEVFGPVVSVLPVVDDDEAVAVANGTRYGLHDYVLSGDERRAEAVATGLDAALVGVNTHARHPEAPFGGAKMSGVGRAGGLLAVHAYTEVVTVTGGGSA